MLQVFRNIALFVCTVVIITGCTTQDFEYKGKDDDVYRIYIENTSNLNVTYTPTVTLFFVDGSRSLNLEEGTIAPDDPEELIVETPEGTYGVSVDVRIHPVQATLRLSLQKGTGTGDNFELDEVVETKNNDYIVFIRYGEVYQTD